MAMNKEGMRQKVKELIEFPMCCAPVKAAAQAWLDAAGTDGEKAAAKALVSALEAEVCTIDETLAFAESDKAKELLGEEAARGFAEQARKTKAEGGKYCFCPACAAGLLIWENRAALG